MARIRTIKPEFWTNEKILSITPLARLMFIGMWNFADDYGRMDFAPISIKARIFPADAATIDDVRSMLSELCSHDLIMIYSANGKEYIEITGWDHQKIDKRQPSKIPAPFDDGSVIRGSPPTPADHSPTPAPVMEGNGREGRGEERKEETREVALSSDPLGFHLFWDIWPNKVGKPAAVKALKSALKRVDDISEILDGVRAYIREKPPDRPWLNPATFLNQNRWEDQPAKVTHGRRTVQDAARDLHENILAGIAAFDEPAPRSLRSGEGEAVVRLLPPGRRE